MMHEIGTYIGDIVGGSVKMHGDTLTDGTRQTIGALYKTQPVPNETPPAMTAKFDAAPKPVIPSLDI